MKKRIKKKIKKLKKSINKNQQGQSSKGKKSHVAGDMGNCDLWII